MISKLPLERFRLPKDGRKWKSVCAQRQRLAVMLEAFTNRYGMVERDVRARLPFKRRTFFNRMADLYKLGFLDRVQRDLYLFTPPKAAFESCTNQGPIGIDVTDRTISM